MATVYRCDRCESIVNITSRADIPWPPADFSDAGSRKVDLCTDCTKSLNLWMRERKDAQPVGGSK